MWSSSKSYRMGDFIKYYKYFLKAIKDNKNKKPSK